MTKSLGVRLARRRHRLLPGVQDLRRAPPSPPTTWEGSDAARPECWTHQTKTTSRGGTLSERIYFKKVFFLKKVSVVNPQICLIFFKISQAVQAPGPLLHLLAAVGRRGRGVGDQPRPRRRLLLPRRPEDHVRATPGVLAPAGGRQLLGGQRQAGPEVHAAGGDGDGGRAVMERGR